MRFINERTGETRVFSDQRWVVLEDRWVELDVTQVLADLASVPRYIAGVILMVHDPIKVEHVKSPTHMDGDPLLQVTRCGPWRTMLPWET